MSSAGAVELRIGLASCGVANGARPVHEALQAAVAEADHGSVKPVGCAGMCHNEPIVEVESRTVFGYEALARGPEGSGSIMSMNTPSLVNLCTR